MNDQQREAQPEPAGYDLADWCKQARVSRTTEHHLAPVLKPHSVKIGRRRIIIESPRDWLLRMQADQRGMADVKDAS